MSEKKSNLKKQVMKRIKAKDVRMHSAVYFTVLSVAFTLSLVLVAFLAAALTHLLLEDVRTGFGAEIHQFGPPGRRALINQFPWLLLVLAVGAIGLTVYLLKKREIAYKHSLVIFYGGVLAAILILSFVVGSLNLDRPLRRAPGVDRIRTFSELRDSRILKGRIESIQEQNIRVANSQGRLINVDVGQARIMGQPQIGLQVHALGEFTDKSEFSAQVIRFLPPPGH